MLLFLLWQSGKLVDYCDALFFSRVGVSTFVCTLVIDGDGRGTLYVVADGGGDVFQRDQRHEAYDTVGEDAYPDKDT